MRNMKHKSVVTCILKQKDKILLVKRGKTAPAYPERWSFIHGLIVDDRTPLQAAIKEIQDETKLTEKDIKLLKKLKPFEQEDREIDTTWEVNAFLFETRKDKITLDFENTEYIWVKPEEIINYWLLPGMLQVASRLIKDLLIKRCGILAIVYRNPDSFLTVKTQNDNIVFVTGGIDKDEGGKDAVIREVMEESGIEIQRDQIKKLPFVNKFTYNKGFLKGVISEQNVYLVKVDEDARIKPENIDVLEAKWMTKDEVRKNLPFDHIKNIFEKSLKYIEV